MNAGHLTSTSAALMKPPRAIIVGCMIILITGFLALLAWSALAELEKVVVAEGRVVPSGDLRTVQNLEGGIIGEIMVESGAAVKKGDPLIRLSSVGLDAQYKDTRQRIEALSIDIVRLTAEVEGKPLSFPDALVAAQPEMIRQARQLHASRLQDMADALAGFDEIIRQRGAELASLRRNLDTLKDNRALLEEDLKMLQPLLATGAVSQAEFSKTQRERNTVLSDLERTRGAIAAAEASLAEVRQQRRNRINSTETEALTVRSEKEVERAGLEESLRASTDKVDRTLVRAPISGIINRVLVNTIGGVIQPGEDLIEIVPAEETLVIEAKVRPEDIAFVRYGQEAFIQLTAYDFAIYGGLRGAVEVVGADTVEDREDSSFFYRVRIRTHTADLERDGVRYPVIPGMVARVDLITGKRTVLDYLLKPITRMKERALRER